MPRSRVSVFLSVACLSLGVLQIVLVSRGFALAASTPRDYRPAPAGFLQFIFRFLPAILLVAMGTGLFFWAAPWGKAVLAAGVAGLTTFQIVYSATVWVVLAGICGLYALVRGVRDLRKWKVARAGRLGRSAEAGGVGTPDGSRPAPSRAGALRAGQVTLVFFLVFSHVLLPLATPTPRTGTPPEIPTDPDSSLDFWGRKAAYLDRYGDRDTNLRAYIGLQVEDVKVEKQLERILAATDGQDFSMTKVLRLLYLENRTTPTGVISQGARGRVKEALLGAKYWYDEPGEQAHAIFWTENHQIAYHAAELLAGQLWKDEVFPRSNMTGRDHIAHAERLASRWMDWRAKYGFFEWHSNTYISVDLYSLLNIVDFAENSTLSTKASMLVDLILFDVANNWFKGKYATTMGRCYGESRVGWSRETLPDKENVAQAAWLLLGLGRDYGSTDKAAVAVATSGYVPPAVLEEIAEDAAPSNEHKERSGVLASAGPSIGIPYDEEHLPFWWGLAAPVSQWTIDATFQAIDKYDLDPAIICGDGVPEILEAGSRIRGMNLSTYSSLLEEVTRGSALETTNTYTYRTPHYQLSGAQDRQKGLNGLQELTWQASLDDNAYVFTNAPGGISFKGGEFMGGWKPRATFYKNIGVIQYDHVQRTLEGRLAFYLLDAGLNLVHADRAYNHAYFPTWAFDSVVERGHWILGKAGGGYVALFSANPTFWPSNYELQSPGTKNCWIVELGSVDEWGSFQDFADAIASSQVVVEALEMGYSVRYASPSRGEVEVAWDGPMTVAGVEVDLGPYARFDDAYCHADFGSLRYEFELGGKSLVLDFENVSRIF
ncbi:MAG: hypothetical protein ACTSU5_14880 [Promethearchaeota archaeon]